VKYVGSLSDLFKNNYQEGVFYGCIDAILVKLIDEKLGTMDTLLTMVNEGRVSLHDGMFASDIVEVLYSDYFYHQNQVFVTKEKMNEEETYTGAFNLEPKKGFFNDVTIFDYESMFPCIMMFGNLGIDTLLGHTKDGGKTFMDIYGNVHELDPERHIFMAQGTVFSKEKDSSTRVVVSTLFNKRVGSKHAADQLEYEINCLKKLTKIAT
jgi:DNA polymerase elongation subunit (family B)